MTDMKEKGRHPKSANQNRRHFETAGEKNCRRRYPGRCLLIMAAAILAAVFLIHSERADAGGKPLYKYYTSIEVESGDTLWDIADQYMTEPYSGKKEYIQEVISMNHLPNDTIYAGRKICVPYYSSEKK